MNETLVTLENYQDFAKDLRGTGDELEGEYYANYYFELPLLQKTGGTFQAIAARAKVTTRRPNAEPPKEADYPNEDEYKKALHQFNNTPSYEQLPELALKAITEDLHKVMTQYGFIYYEV